MSVIQDQKDLAVIVPDADYEFSLGALLRSRQKSLGMRNVSFEIRRHPQRDAGCRSDCHNFLRPWLRSHRFAMVVFDHEGCGEEGTERVELENQIESTLRANGWNDRCAAVVVRPELEAWVWSKSVEVDEILGWKGRSPDLRTWVRCNTGFWADGCSKPDHPKEAFLAALREVRKRQSSSLFEELAQRVSFSGCKDPAFQKFRRVLRSWFPDTGRPTDAVPEVSDDE